MLGAVPRDQGYLQALLDGERPARMVGLFSGQAMKAKDLQRLVDACVKSMRSEDGGASLTVTPLGNPSAQDLAAQRTWRITVVDGMEASPHDCLVQMFDMRDPESPHRRLLDHIGGRDQELSEAASHLQENRADLLEHRQREPGSARADPSLPESRVPLRQRARRCHRRSRRGHRHHRPRASGQTRWKQSLHIGRRWARCAADPRRIRRDPPAHAVGRRRCHWRRSLRRPPSDR